MWASNSPWNGSGYGVQTMLVTPRLQATGHDVAIAANYGVEGCTLTLEGPREGIPVFPKGGEEHSIQMCAEHANHWGADVLLTHYDAWVYDPERYFKLPWVPWYPVDTEELQTQVEEKIKHAKLRVTQTRHGQEATQARGMSCEYVPAAYNKDEYHPVDGAAWREGAGVKPGQHLVLMVAANKGAPGAPSRKSFGQAFEGFKLFLEHTPDAVLYVHTIMKGHLDLLDLASRIGIGESIMFSHPYPLVAGLCPSSDMAAIYSAADVLLSPSMGEGFGVPIIEAQACGTPVITGDWTSMGEITRTGVAIPKSESVPYDVPHGGNFYGRMRIVRPEAVRDALIESVGWKHKAEDVAAGVSEYEISTVYRDHWVPVVEKVEDVVMAGAAAKTAAVRKRERRAARRQQVKGGAAAAAA